MSEPTAPGGEVRIVLTTCPTEELARSVAATLVGERLAACGNIVPGLRSIYRWRGEIEREDETLVILKTVVGRLEAIAGRLRELHPYDVPEMLVLDVDRGAPDYLRWVVEETRDGP